MIAALSDSQFQIVATAFGILFLGAWQAFLSYKQNEKTKAVETKVDSAEVKRTETALVVNEIKKDVNSKSDAQLAQIKDLVSANKELASEMAVLRERLRAPAAPASAPASPLTQAAGGPITPVLAVPATTAGPHGPVTADNPQTGRTVTLTEEQFQTLINRK